MNPKTPYQKMRENREKEKRRQILRVAIQAQEYAQHRWSGVQDRTTDEWAAMLHEWSRQPGRITARAMDELHGQGYSAAYFGDAGGLPR